MKNRTRIVAAMVGSAIEQNNRADHCRRPIYEKRRSRLHHDGR